jgi:hypothetical protein
VYKKRILRRIFGRKRETIMGGWRKLHKEEVYNLYASPYIFRTTKWRRMRWLGRIARTGQMTNAYTISVGKPEGMRPHGIPRRR